MKKSLKIENKIQKTNQKIMHLKKLINFSIYPFQKLYYNEILKQEMKKLKQLNSDYNDRCKEQVNSNNQREFTIEELAQYDGSNGKPAYVAVNGIVYDLSNEITWGGGTHFGLYSGKDLTSEFMKCHGKEEILNNLPKVGVLKK